MAMNWRDKPSLKYIVHTRTIILNEKKSVEKWLLKKWQLGC